MSWSSMHREAARREAELRQNRPKAVEGFEKMMEYAVDNGIEIVDYSTPGSRRECRWMESMSDPDFYPQLMEMYLLVDDHIPNEGRV